MRSAVGRRMAADRCSFQNRLPVVVARRSTGPPRIRVDSARRHGETAAASARTVQSLIKTTLLVATVLAANPVHPSGAAEFRRHHRRLQTESSLDVQLLKDDRKKKKRRETERAKKARAEKEELDRALKEAKLKDDVLLQSVESIKKALNANSESKGAKRFSMSARGRPAPSSVYGSIRQRDSPMAAGNGHRLGPCGGGAAHVLQE